MGKEQSPSDKRRGSKTSSERTQRVLPADGSRKRETREIIEKKVHGAHSSEHNPHQLSQNERQAAHLFVQNYLGEHESYLSDSPVTHYVQRRLDVIAGGREAKVIVVHDESPNAMALPGVVIVHDGLLALADYEEEIDGILGHEWSHISKGHVHHEGKADKGGFASIGKQRKHETEADFAPIELLDKRGINPAGLLSMFAKMEQWQKEQLAKEITEDSAYAKRRKLIAEADPIHGSLLDRRLQLRDAGKFIDVRNLSDEFTPLPLSEEALASYQKDSELWGQFDSLPPLEKRQFLQRQFQGLLSDDYSQGIDPEQRAKLRQLVSWQHELIADTTPGLTEEEVTERTNATLYLGYHVKRIGHYDEKQSKWIDHSDVLLSAGVDFEAWYNTYDTKEKVARLFALSDDDSFQQLGITLESDNYALGAIAEKIFSAYVNSQEDIDIPGYIDLMKETGIVARAKAPLYSSERLFYEPLLAGLKQKGQYTEETMRELADALTETSVSQGQIETTLSLRLPEMDIPEKDRTLVDDAQRIKRYDPVGQSLLMRFRQNRLSAIEAARDDPLRLFTIDVGREYDLKVAEVIAEHFPVERTLAFVAAYQQSHDEPLPDAVREKIIETYGNVFLETFLPLRELKTINQSDFESRMKIWSLAPDKDTYLEKVKKDLSLLFENRKRSSRELEKLARAIMQTPVDMARQLSLEVPWKVEKEDLSGLSELMNATIEKAFEKAETTNDPAEITKLIQSVPVFNTKDKRWDAVVAQFIEGDVALNDLEKAEQLFALGVTTDNPHVLLEVPAKAAETYVVNTDFDEGIRFLFDTYAHMPRHLFDRALNYLIEEKARTPEEFDQLEARVRDEVNKLFSDDTTIGELAVADAFLIDQIKTPQEERTREVGIRSDTISGIDAGELLEAMLASGESDEQLKRLLLERWWLACRLGTPSVQNNFDIEGGMSTFRHPGKDAQFAHWAHEVPASYTSFADVMSNVQLANTPMKVATLRKVLTGEGGVLASDEKKRAFVESFLAEKVDRSGSDDRDMTSELLHSLVEVGEQEELYHQLSPLLQGMILGVPEHPTELRVFAREKGRELLADLERRGLIKNPTDRDRIHLTRKIYSLMTGGRKNEVAQDLSSADRQLLSLVAEETEQGEEGKLTPWNLAIRVGKATGAFGTRTLQMADQYFDVPEEERENVRDVYDDMQGQSRLQAYRVLKREAASQPEMAAFMDDLVEIRPRIGGGSLMTVYECEFADGRIEAVGVRNPNVKYTLNKTVDLIQRAINRAKEKNPENRHYQLLEVLIGDVQEWIHDELDDPRFEEKDQQFRVNNDSRYGAFDSGTHRYAIQIPESQPTGTRWVRRDEYIEGKNLTSLEVVDGQTNIEAGQISRSDYGDAVAVLAKNYFHQLATGLVHSDIHPGQFRITSDNQRIAIFDRYNLLELSDRDQQFISNMFGAFGAGDSRGVSQHFVDYLLELDANSAHRQQRDALIAEIATKVQGESMVDSLIALKQHGIKVPYQIGLIGRGLQVFDSMSKQAGYQNLIGALSA